MDTEFDPVTQGLLAAAFAGLQASGPSRMPVSLGQIIGQAGTAGMGQYGAAIKDARAEARAKQLMDLEKQKAELTKEQIAQMRAKTQALSGMGAIGVENPDQMEAAASTLWRAGLHDEANQLLMRAKDIRSRQEVGQTRDAMRPTTAPIGAIPALGVQGGIPAMRSIIPSSGTAQNPAEPLGFNNPLVPAGPMVQPPGATEPIPPGVAAATAEGRDFAIGVGPSANPAENKQLIPSPMMGGLLSSRTPGIASAAGGLTQMMSNPNFRFDPKAMSSEIDRLSGRETSAQQSEAMARMAVASRAPQAGVAVVGPDGKPTIVAKGQDIGMTPAIGAMPITMTPEAINDAAARYNMDGTLPPMGMKAGGDRTAILNRAAELKAPGITGEDQRIGQIANKANAAALSKIQQQATMVGAFEKNFTKNADIAIEYSTKTDKTGVPIVNKWINAGKRAITGDPALSAYDAVIKSVVNEYTKIISGSMGNMQIAEGEIKKIENLLTAAQTPEQVKAVIDLMKRETGNRMKGFEEEKDMLRKSMRTVPVPKFANEESQKGRWKDL